MRHRIFSRHFSIAKNFYIAPLVSTSAKHFQDFVNRSLGEHSSDLVWYYIQEAVKETKDYDELFYSMLNLSKFYHHIRDKNNKKFAVFLKEDANKTTALQNLFWGINSDLRSRQNERIELYLKAYKNKTPEALQTIIFESKEALKTPSLTNVEDNAKYHAALMALHPEFQYIAVLDRCVPATMILMRAKENFFGTILFVTEEELSHVPASLADEIIVVSSLNNHEECVSKLEAHLEKKGISKLRVALDPGWGVGSENRQLSESCEGSILFVGPDPVPMTMLGDKWHSNNLAQSLGVDVIPGYYGEAQDAESIVRAAYQLGLGTVEIMVKGPGGGGSGNTKIGENSEVGIAEMELRIAIDNIRQKDKDAQIILQLVLKNLIHKEVQVIVGPEGAVYLAERECSKQTRRGQKNFEESVYYHDEDPELREASLKIANAASILGYRGVMTVEFFIVGNKKYFGEVNPRLQVENGVTIRAMGGFNIIDLRHSVAAGCEVKTALIKWHKEQNRDWFRKSIEEMVVTAKAISPSKFVIQARVQAELLEVRDGIFTAGPVEGHVTELRLPSSGVFCGVKKGSYVNTYEVSQIIAIVYGEGSSPQEARQNLLDKLLEFKVKGIPTNLDYLIESLKYWLKNPEIEINTSTCRHFERHYGSVNIPHENPTNRISIFAAGAPDSPAGWEFDETSSYRMGRD